MSQNEIEKLTNEELEETIGGAGGYGDIQFECACGANFLSETMWVIHLREHRHKYGIAYYQKAKGKGHKGNKIGRVNVKYEETLNLNYPNGKVSRWAYAR